jgi:hypothetical protein
MPGCCDEDSGVCRDGTSAGACGVRGSCQRCDTPGGEACVGQQCCVPNSAGTDCCPKDKICGEPLS